jgi:hypothetical protein
MAEKTRAGGTLTEAQFRQRLVSALRRELRWWKPKSAAMAKARTRRGFYQCASCLDEVPLRVLDEEKGKKVANVFADHTVPIVGPEGFTSWDDWVARAFVEVDGYQVLCKACHHEKTQRERKERGR